MKDQPSYDCIKINAAVYTESGDKINLNEFIDEFVTFIESKGMLCFSTYSGVDEEDDDELDG